MRWAAAALVLAAAVGCSQEPSADDGVLAFGGRPARLVSLPQWQLALCHKSHRLRPACPRRAPATRHRYLAHLSRGGSPGMDVFDLERGGEDPRKPGGARPPAVAHLTIVGGNVEGMAPFLGRQLGGRPVRLRAGLMRTERTEAVYFGRVRWSNQLGALFLAPPFLHGGQLGNHVCFRWRSSGTEFIISLHGWEPLPDAAATLKAIVESTRS